MGSLIPMEAEPSRWLWLALSGVVGLILGDHFLLLSYSLLGSHLAMLIFSTSPLLSALFARIAFGEILGFEDMLGILLTVGGILLVVMERRERSIEDRRLLVQGAGAALLAAAGQALGLIFAKKGMEGEFSAFSAVVIRMLAAVVVIWLIAWWRGQVRPTLKLLGRNRYTGSLLVGTFLGPYIGVWVSLLAVQLTTNLGVASALMSLAPIILLPIERFWFGRPVRRSAVVGTLVATAGVILLVR
jgi:drug/metabolite transporter (DMT)-like permease